MCCPTVSLADSSGEKSGWRAALIGVGTATMMKSARSSSAGFAVALAGASPPSARRSTPRRWRRPGGAGSRCACWSTGRSRWSGAACRTRPRPAGRHSPAPRTATVRQASLQRFFAGSWRRTPTAAMLEHFRHWRTFLSRPAGQVRGVPVDGALQPLQHADAGGSRAGVPPCRCRRARTHVAPARSRGAPAARRAAAAGAARAAPRIISNSSFERGHVAHGDVVGLVHRLRILHGERREQVGLHDVVDVAEVARGLAVAVDVGGLAAQHRADPGRDHRRRRRRWGPGAGRTR